jgi:hypothetical protein
MRPMQEERETVAMRRDRLLDLIDQTATPPVQHAHTVPRERVRARDAVRRIGLAPLARPDDDEDLDTDIGPSLSPLLVLGVIALLLVVFVAATQLR